MSWRPMYESIRSPTRCTFARTSTAAPLPRNERTSSVAEGSPWPLRRSSNPAAWRHRGLHTGCRKLGLHQARHGPRKRFLAHDRDRHAAECRRLICSAAL